MAPLPLTLLTCWHVLFYRGAPVLVRLCFGCCDCPVVLSVKRDDGNGQSEISEKQKEEIESDARRDRSSQSTHTAMLAIDILLELDIIYHRASLKLMQLNAGEPQLPRG